MEPHWFGSLERTKTGETMAFPGLLISRNVTFVVSFSKAGESESWKKESEEKDTVAATETSAQEQT